MIVSEPAPEDQVRGRRHRPGLVQREHREATRGVPHVVRTILGQECCPDGDPPCLVLGQEVRRLRGHVLTISRNTDVVLGTPSPEAEPRSTYQQTPASARQHGRSAPHGNGLVRGAAFADVSSVDRRWCRRPRRARRDHRPAACRLGAPSPSTTHRTTAVCLPARSCWRRARRAEGRGRHHPLGRNGRPVGLGANAVQRARRRARQDRHGGRRAAGINMALALAARIAGMGWRRPSSSASSTTRSRPSTPATPQGVAGPGEGSAPA